MDEIRLTKSVNKGGCAAKVAAQVLHEVLRGVRFPTPHPELLVDSSTFDDAAIYRVSDELALVQTLDFFTPILDDPYSFGKVAAANALSDVYAMGGSPKTCLAILAFPLAKFAPEVGSAVLQGASDIIEEAKATLVGGHSIDDDTLKFGLSVTGFVHPADIWTNAKARPGDRLILTKAIGTGTLLAGLKSDAYTEADLQDVVSSMIRLNRVRELLSDSSRRAIHAATDVTGFGVAGHAMQMAVASSVSIELKISEIPVFSKTRASLEAKRLTKAHRTNFEYTSSRCNFEALSDIDKLIIFDPQTSGGLLLSVADDQTEAVLGALHPSFPDSRIIGRVIPAEIAAVRFISL